ncbi:MAG: cation:proton antiporter [Gemmataceae bacterium]|nr:cation:proton antiporter [Gemmataceae bacterium]
MPESIAHDQSALLIELGLAVAGLAVLARLAGWLGVPAIPLYLLGGLAFGNGGVAPVTFSQEYVETAGELGVLLLLFTLGLEYTGAELRHQLAAGFPSGVIDLLLNFTPGVAAGLILGWGPVPAVLLGGVTAISSSGIAAKVMADFGWGARPEAKPVVTVLVLEDLAMAAFLPLAVVLAAGAAAQQAAASVGLALAVGAVVLVVALRYGPAITRLLDHRSDEAFLLGVFGLMVLVAGFAERAGVSAEVGAFLVGIAVSGAVAHRAGELVAPLRELFAAFYFLAFGLSVNPRDLPPVLLPAALLAVATTLTKFAAGWWAARRAGVEGAGRWRAGAVLVARGEFSIVIAGLGAAAEPRLGPLAAAYVLILAVAGPVLARLAGRLPDPPADAKIPTAPPPEATP